MQVELKDGREFPGRVYGIDTLTDLAIVKVDATGLQPGTAYWYRFKHGGEERALLRGAPFGRLQFVLATLQLDEKGHLGLDHGRHQRLGQEVHRAHRVGFFDRQLGAVGGHEDDGRRAGARGVPATSA